MKRIKIMRGEHKEECATVIGVLWGVGMYQARTDNGDEIAIPIQDAEPFDDNTALKVTCELERRYGRACTACESKYYALNDSGDDFVCPYKEEGHYCPDIQTAELGRIKSRDDAFSDQMKAVLQNWDKGHDSAAQRLFESLSREELLKVLKAYDDIISPFLFTRESGIYKAIAESVRRISSGEGIDYELLDKVVSKATKNKYQSMYHREG